MHKNLDIVGSGRWAALIAVAGLGSFFYCAPLRAQGRRPATTAPVLLTAQIDNPLSAVNVLILVLDNLSDDGGTLPGFEQPVAAVASNLALVRPTQSPTSQNPATTATWPRLQAPVDRSMPPAAPGLPPAGAAPAIAPALPAITPAQAKIRPRIIVSADKKPSPDDEFSLEPDTGGYHDNHTAPAPSVDATTPMEGYSSRAPVVIATSGGSDQSDSTEVQSAAAHLRRALLRAGFTDVLSSTLQEPVVTRAVDERRLTPRVLETLRLATVRVVNSYLKAQPTAAGKASNTPASAAPADSVALQTRAELTRIACQSASRIGDALGYRAVVVLAILPSQAGGTTDVSNTGSGAAVPTIPAVVSRPAATSNSIPTAPSPPVSATYAMLVVDAQREAGQVVIYDESGPDLPGLHEIAAGTGAGFVQNAVKDWQNVTPQERAQTADDHMTQARAAYAAGDLPKAQDQVNQVLAIDPRRADAYVLLGDILQKDDPTGAIAAYNKATALNSSDGQVWTKIAIANTLGDHPDWPRALDAGRHALALNYDSAALQTAMAAAQYGRAELFRRANRPDDAEDAEIEARKHLDLALTLPSDDPRVVRMLAKQLVTQGRYSEAVQSLDMLARKYPTDLDIQTQYATALTGLGGRDADAFVAWARVWKIEQDRVVQLDENNYRHLAEGFDERAAQLGKDSSQLTAGVANGALPREQALLQLTRLQDDMTDAQQAVGVMKPADRFAGVQKSRVFAADLLNQALEADQVYLETGQDIYRTRGLDLDRQAIMVLNAARTAAN